MGELFDYPGYWPVSKEAYSREVDSLFGQICHQLILLGALPRGGFLGWTLEDRLLEPDSALSMFERYFMSSDSLSWVLPVRYQWNSCLFGVLAHLADQATLSYWTRDQGKIQTEVPICYNFFEAAEVLETKVTWESGARAAYAQTAAEACMKLNPLFTDGRLRRAVFLGDGRDMFEKLGRLTNDGVSDAVAPLIRSRRLAICGAIAGDNEPLPRFLLAGERVEVHLLGATIVYGFLELVIFVSLRHHCIPLVDAVSALSLPHVFLLGWRCLFGDEEDDTQGATLATVLSYYGSEAVVRCPLTRDEDVVTLSLVPGLPYLRMDWALRAMRLCPAPEFPSSPLSRKPSVQPTLGIPNRWRLAICSQPMYNVHGREDQFHQWVEYHRLEVGVEHFFLYDNDGSLNSSLLQKYVSDGVVSYIPRFPRHFSPAMEALHKASVRDARSGFPIQNISAPPIIGNSRFPSALSTQAESHCLFRARFAADYVLFLHSFDAYVAFPASRGPPMRGLISLFDKIEHAKSRSKFAAFNLRYISFGGQVQQGAEFVIERFVHRSPFDQVLVTSNENESMSFSDDDFVLAGQPVVVPENVVSVVGSHWARGRPGMLQIEGDKEEAVIFHYTDLLTPRCKNCFVKDYTMEAPAARLKKHFQRFKTVR